MPQVLTGDQGNRTTLARWIAEAGGSFDMIVDDGGHYNAQVMTRYTMLATHPNPNPNPTPTPNPTPNPNPNPNPNPKPTPNPNPTRTLTR